MRTPSLHGSRTPRQQQFVEAAARLFAQRGYHSVGINEISAELGLSGPAIYRHYPSKEALLVAVLDDVVMSHLEEVREIASGEGRPIDVLRAMVDNHGQFVFTQAEHVVTWRTEFRNIPAADRDRLRYLQRLYTEEWVRVLRRVRPDLGDDQARAMCHAAMALLQSPAEFRSPLGRTVVERLLADMVMRALAEAGGSESATPGEPSVVSDD